MKRLLALFIIPLLMISASYADSYYNQDSQEQRKSDNYQGHSADDKELMSAYNAPARIDVKGCYDLFIIGSYLYWQPIIQDLILAREEFTDAGGTDYVKYIDIDPDYTSAFKIGVGKNFAYDNWVAYIEYSRFHSSDSRSYTLPEGLYVSVPTWLTYDNFAHLVDNNVWGKWKLHLDLLDLEISRPYYLGNKLTFLPHAGLRGGWIDQNIDARYTDVITLVDVDSNNESDSWIIGPRMGLDANWHLGEGFCIFGNAAASLLYQNSKAKMKHQDCGNPHLLYLNIIRKKSQITPNFEAALGLGWGTYFDNMNWHFGLTAGYDFHIFWHQNYLQSLMNTFRGELIKEGNLMLHGLTITGRFDF